MGRSRQHGRGEWPGGIALAGPLALALAIGCGDGSSRAPGRLDAAPDAPTDAGVPDDAARHDGPSGSDAAPGPDATPPDMGGRDEVPDPPPTRVLFVGNSYTYVNDLPGVVAMLGAATPGAAIEVESIAIGGARLVDHWDDPATRERVTTGGFDAVVLQGQSLEPLTSVDDFSWGAMAFAFAARDAGARTLWYATWARRPGDPIYREWGIDDAAMTAALDMAYRYVADTYGGFVARVGVAWELARAELPEVELYDADGSHPSQAGTLLAACVMVQAISGRAPRVPDPAPFGLARETAEALCALAPRVECPGERARCGDACVDLSRDAAHCGACDALCSAPRACAGGVCSCPRAQWLTATYAELGTTRAECDDPATAAACDAAFHRFCAAQACATSGYGPTPGGFDETATLVCLAGDVRDTTYAELRTFVAECDGTTARSGEPCAIATGRACVAAGALGGFGPFGVTGDAVQMTCVPTGAGVVLHLSYSELARIRPACDGTTQRAGPDCDFAMFVTCRSMGHAGGGFGPVDGDGPNVDVLCVDG